MAQFGTARAVGAALEADFAEFHRQRIETHQTPGQRLANADQQLDGLGRLDHPDHAGQHADHATGAAIGRQFCGRCAGEQAAVARPALVVEHADLPVETVDGAIYQGFSKLDARVIDQVAGVEIVGAVDHQVIGAHQFQGVIGIQRGVVGVDLDMTVEVLQALPGGFDLGHTEGAVAMDDLALQVAAFHHVEIHQAHSADAGRRQVQADGRAQAAGADDQHFCFLEVQLTFAADAGQGDMAHVALDFFVAQGVDVNAA